MSDETARIIITGGGSGGHVAPLIAIARKIIDLTPEVDIRYIGGNGFTKQLFEGEKGIIIDIIRSGKLRRYFSIRNITDIFSLAAGILQSLWKLFWLMPDVVVSKGGYGSLPVVVAAIFYRIPLVIHESDASPGLVNKFSAKFATRIGISFKNAAKYFPKNKTALVGNPIRENLFEHMAPQETAKKRFGFNSDEPILLILGGSQGAQNLNDFILNMLLELTRRFQVLHQTGEKNYKNVKAESDLIIKKLNKEAASRYKIFGFFKEDQLSDAMNAADIIISRAGSGTIYEMAIFEKPSVLIPLKNSANNHQKLNAIEYYKSGCCIYFEEDNLLPNLFLTQITDLLANTEKRQQMTNSCKSFARKNSAEIMAKEIIRISGAKILKSVEKPRKINDNLIIR